MAPPGRPDPDHLERIARAIAGNPYIRQAPTPKQLAFLADPRLEVLYGGGGGGGKSSALLMAALMFADVPGYSALILRRTYPDLAQPGGIMDRAREWLADTDARWSETEHRVRFPGGGTLQFGYLSSVKDRFRYLGGEYTFCAFDELTMFEELSYRYLFSRLRSSHGMPLRMRAATNPGGIGHDWVRSYFVDSTDPSRSFHPALLEDNPHLSQEEYDESLSHLDPVTRLQIRRGDWTARDKGALFQREWFDVVDELGPWYAEARPVRFWDLASTEPQPGRKDPDYTAGLKLARDNARTLYVVDLRHAQLRPHDVRDLVQATARADGARCRQRMMQDPGQAGVDQIEDYRRNVLPFADFDGVRLTGAKWLRAQPVARRAGARNVKVVRGPWNEVLFSELEAFREDGQYAHDDIVDTLSGAYGVLEGGGIVDVSSFASGGGRTGGIRL